MNREDRSITKTDEFDRNLRIMEVVEKELEQQKGEAVFCLLFFLCAINVWILLVALWDKLGRPIRPELMTVGVEVIAAVMLLVVLKYTRIDIRKMGVSAKNLLPSLKRAGIISAIIIAIMLAFKLITRPGQPVFNWKLFDFTYIITSPLQEFLARGFLLTTLVNINTAKNARHIAVICSSLLFTSLHLYYGFTYMLGAGVLSVLLGYCYMKDENIWGVSLIHFVFGTVGVMMELV